mmetsp:Transcript_12405/g.12185  ORF Transcript_12405/g.12185 Transcript_12405/m.12185 type:complete len:90 (+) Transcript_12405:663-932(+)
MRKEDSEIPFLFQLKELIPKELNLVIWISQVAPGEMVHFVAGESVYADNLYLLPGAQPHILTVVAKLFILFESFLVEPVLPKSLGSLHR